MATVRLETQNFPLKRDWYVLQVKPRVEKRVSEYMRVYGYFFYLPLRKHVVKIQRRKRTTWLPLFPGYVFTRLFPEERLKMLQTNLLVRTLRVDRPRVLVHELRQVERALKAKPDLVPTARVFHEGEQVRIVAGPFRGLEGVVMKAKGSLSVVLNVEMIGQSVSLAISPASLEVKKVEAAK